jgi:hypothetical protein
MSSNLHGLAEPFATRCLLRNSTDSGLLPDRAINWRERRVVIVVKQISIVERIDKDSLAA